MAIKVKSYEDFEYGQLLTYAGIDTIVTYELFKKLYLSGREQTPYKYYLEGKGLTPGMAPSLLDEAREIKEDALAFMVEMISNGLQYDVDLNRQYDREMTARLSELEEGIFSAVGKRWNLDSDLESEEVLFKQFGFKTDVKTKGGKESLSGDALLEMYKRYQQPWLKALIERNDVASVHRSFISGYVERHVKRDGRIHPNYNLHGTSSHRISGDNPNLLNIPTPKHGYSIRRLFTVRPGYAFLTFDFSSCEVKVLAALCKDETMLKAILSGLDFHTYTASQMQHIPYDAFKAILDNEEHPEYKKYKKWRQEAKAVTFGLLYGSSVAGVAANIGCSPDEAQKIIDSYFKTYPGIKVFVEKCHKEAAENKWVHTVFKQRKMQYGLLDMFKGTAVYNAGLRNAQNVLIQSPASTLGLVAFSKFAREIKKLGGMAICTVYDSIELEVPIENLAKAVELGYYCLDDYPVEKFEWLDFKIGCDCEVGFNWGDLTKCHRNVTQPQVLALLEKSRAGH